MNNDGNASEHRTGGRTARTGVWFVGARGSVATTAVAGCAAVTAGLRPPTGMVTETAHFDGTGLPPLPSLVFGGHDTAHSPLPKRAEHLTDAGVLPHGLVPAVRAELQAADDPCRARTTGTVAGPGRTDACLRAVAMRDALAEVAATGLRPDRGTRMRAMIPLQARLAARSGASLTPVAVLGRVPMARALARKVSPA